MNSQRIHDALLGAVSSSTGITFAPSLGSNVRFSEPTSFRFAILPRLSGLYAILVYDITWRPRLYRPIYFGQAEDGFERVTSSHEKFADWCKAANGAQNLFVSYCSMIGSTEDTRVAVESGLIAHYSPVCNKQFNPFAGLLKDYKPTGPVPGASNSLRSALGFVEEPARTTTLADLLGYPPKRRST